MKGARTLLACRFSTLCKLQHPAGLFNIQQVVVYIRSSTWISGLTHEWFVYRSECYCATFASKGSSHSLTPSPVTSQRDVMRASPLMRSSTNDATQLVNYVHTLATVITWHARSHFKFAYHAVLKSLARARITCSMISRRRQATWGFSQVLCIALFADLISCFSSRLARARGPEQGYRLQTCLSDWSR